MDSLKQSIDVLQETQHSGEVPEIENVNDQISELSQILLLKQGDDEEQTTPSMTPEQLSDYIKDKMVCPQ